MQETPGACSTHAGVESKDKDNNEPDNTHHQCEETPAAINIDSITQSVCQCVPCSRIVCSGAVIVCS